MNAMHCFYWALAVFGLTVAAGAVLIAIKPIILALLMPIRMYWNWVIETFESEFVQTIVAVAPVAGVAFGIVFFVACLLTGGKP